MTRHNEPEELLAAMLELPAEERAAFLEDQCGSDAALRVEVDKLRQACEPPSAPPDVQDEAGSYVEELLGACSEELWQNPVGLPATVAASRVSGAHPSFGDRYEILWELGHGGMGTVYLAKDNKLKRRIALKMLPEACINEPRRRAMFEREACTAANLSHANVATVYEFEEFEGKPYIAMEYVEGLALRHILAEEKPLPVPRLLDFALQLTEGLHAAHRQSIIHRDLKPGNVMVTGDGLVKILDFGLAKALQTGDWGDETGSGPESVGSSGVLLGTPGYMSPEQARREGDVDERTDLFSLGIVLYEMATGNGPFHRDTPEESISAALNDVPPPVTSFNSDLPPAVADVINKLLAKDREARYQSAEQVLKELRRLAASQEAEKWKMRLRSRGVVKKKGLRKWWVVAAAGVLIVAGVILKDTIWPTSPDLNVSEQITTHGNNADFRKAYALLGKEEKRFGKDHAVLASLRFTIGTKLAKLHREECNNLIQFLADGRDDKIAALSSRLKVLEDICGTEGVSRGGDSQTAGKLIEKARKKRQQLAAKREKVQTCIQNCHWLDALDACQELEKETFEGKTFRPFELEAMRFMAEIVEAVCAQKDVDLDEVGQSIRVLERINPAHPELPGMRDTRKRLHDEKELTRLSNTISADSSLEDIGKILGEMEKRGPEHRLTKKVQELYHAMQKQVSRNIVLNELKSNVIRTFSNRARAELEVKVDTARESGGLETKDLESLDAAVKWLRDLNRALGLGVAELDEAERVRRLLGKAQDKLPEYTKKAASRHLAALDDHIQRRQQIADADLLYQDIMKLRATRELPRAQEKLEMLKTMDLPELKAKVASATEQVQQLASEVGEEQTLAMRFQEYLKSLHAREFGRAQVLLDALQHGWRKIKGRLDTAISASGSRPEVDLLLNRAQLDLRLDRPGDAETDAARALQLATTPEQKQRARLVWVQAKFAQSESGKTTGRDAAKLRAALACLKEMRDSEQVLYWRGVCEGAMALDSTLEERKRQEYRRDALGHLQQVIKTGKGPAEAYLLVADLLKGNTGERGRAIKRIEESFGRPWTEEGLIAVFGKVPDIKQAKEQWRNTYITQAVHYQRLGEWRKSLEPGQNAVRIGGAYFWSYATLASAKLGVDDIPGCRSALEKAESLMKQLPEGRERNRAEVQTQRLRAALRKRQ